MDLADSVARARDRVGDADAVVVSAGAGMGVDSGLPDFRGNRGFWNAYPMAESLGLSFTDLASPAHFVDNPRLAWAFYGHRLNLYRNTVPHAGFARLLDLCQSKSAGYFVFTSNVDGHFQQAGFDSERVVECHGSIHRLQCTACGTRSTWPADEVAIEIDIEAFQAGGQLPRCPHCGALARPNILMFGDYGWISDVTDQQHQAMQRWWNDVTAQNLGVVILEIGAGNAVPTVRRFGEHLARYSRASFIRINPREAEVPDGSIGIALNAAKALRLLLTRK